MEALMPVLLGMAALVSVLTSFGIIMTLVVDGASFFRAVPLREIFGTEIGRASCRERV